MSLNIDLNEGGTSHYVLINLFLDAMRKFGRSKEIKSMSYDCDGLTIVDGSDVVWSLEVNAKVKFPDNLEGLPNSRVNDSDSKTFCLECDAGMSETSELCSYCEYLRRI